MLPVADEPVVLEDQVVHVADVGHLHVHCGILLCVWGFTQYMCAGGESCMPAGNGRSVSEDSFQFLRLCS